jgi:eukaryotic-like serine/threonine-protein kinase
VTALSPDRDTIAQKLRDLGFDETVAIDPGATIRADPSAVTAEELPRISIDLPATNGGVRAVPSSSRAELEVRGVLGEGGMGRVFLARQRSLDREVAIKTLREHASQGDHDALLLEGTVTGRLEHPSIVPVHALGVHDDGRPILVMKLVDGVAWSELLRDPKHPAWDEWSGDTRDRLEAHLEILMQVCNAVHFAHEHGFVHRDIKPANVLIGRFGDVYLADWGIAHRIGSSESRVCGTSVYMAPEMALAGNIDARTDVYLLGATLHELLTGKRRHEGETTFIAMMNAILSPPVDYASTIPEELAALANRATARDPLERPESAAAFRLAIAAYRRHKTSVALSDSALPRLEKLHAAGADADELIAEARFAIAQALEHWPENPAALRAERELADILAARRRRAAELEMLAHDHDPRVALRERTVVMGGLGVAAVLVLGSAIANGVRYVPTARELVMISSFPLVALITITIAMRRSLLRTALNRHAVLSLLLGAATITAAALLGVVMNVAGPVVIAFQSLAIAALATLSSITIFRWIRFMAALLLATAAISAAAPAYAHFTFSLATSLSIALAVVFGRRVTPSRT